MTNRKHYTDKPTADWNANDFLAYLTDRHLEVYGVEYRPYRSWAAERGLIGGLIGTKPSAGKSGKPRKYEPEVVREFIDRCFANHRVSAQYPGVSFTWWWTYKTAEWQRVLAANAPRKAWEERRQATEGQAEYYADWW